MSNFTKLKLCHTFGISQSTHIWVKGALTALLLVLCGNVAKAQSDLTFNEGIRYSKWVIDSRMNDFYANTTKCGFAVYDQNGKQTAGRVDGKTSLDYVVGLVAKSIIEASQYYSQFTWAQSFAKPWFLSIQNYGNNFYSGVATSGGSLDDLNAVKLYLPLRELTKSGGTFEDNNTYSNTATALNKAITGLKEHNTKYRIKDENILAKKAGHDVLGGWWHKKAYENQMWLDGAYMGSALFAELVNYSGKKTNIDSSNDWDLIVKQLTILHEMCWNSDDMLPYHAFAADGGTNETSHSNTWYGLSHSEPYVFHSASYWGRAVGWYFLALVDILEQMQKANIASTDTKFTTLKGYLEEIAGGLKARQDQATGGWYQILDENGTYSASSYNGKSYTKTYNYIESSATALFTAAYLKAIRKGYLDETIYKTVAVNGYKCLVNQFFSVDDNGNVNIFGSCRSAGLGGNEDKNAAGKEKFRDGSKPYYLLGSDVARVDKSEGITEGKVLGAFILAATEYERQYQPSMLLSNDLNKTYTLGPNESLSAEVLGEGTATYQWFDATGTTPSAITGATNASYIPTESGKYYCKITVTPPSSTAAKTRAASTEPYTITTSTADVTVAAAGGETGGSVTGEVIYFTSGKTSSNENVLKVNQGNTKGVSVKYGGKTYTNGVKMESSTNITLTLTAESKVTFVFDTASKKFKIGDNSYTTGEDGTFTITLEAGSYTISKRDKGVALVAVDIQPTAPSISISISTQPESTDYLAGATVKPLTVVATLDGYSLSYQWYENTTNSNTGGNPISGATTKSYTPTLSSTGTTYYYCVVTATKEGSETLTATSDVAKITVSEPYIKFTKQPTSGSYAINDAASALTVVAATNLGVEPTYQWYSNSSKATEGSTLIENATSASYTPSTSTVGTKYYYCKASATLNGKTYEDISNIVSIEVVTAIYKYKVSSGDKSPGVNGVKYIEDNAGNTKVKMTFGGWKWGTNTDKNDHSYYVPNKKNELQVDSWSAAETEGVSKLDGYDYWFSGGKDAVDESKAASKDENGKEVPIYGSVRYGWFKTNTTDSEGKVTTYPFTLPVRGAYMTFEPTKNGWLTIYILQNGVWNTYDKATTVDGIEYAKGAIKPGEFRMHSFFITNQRGLTVQDFAPGMYSYDVNQKVQSGYSCSIYERDKKPADAEMNIHGKDVSYWPEFWTLDDDEREAVYTHWKDGDNGSETVIELTNGSFLLIQKAVIKYRFHVTGNETYYFFSNFSKMGFAGAEFQPDNAQPTKTLSLSDTEKYTAPKAGTDAVVGNVTIPQYESITLDRTFKAGQWTTLTLPFNLTQDEVQSIFGDGTQIIMLDKATLSSEGGARLTFIYHEIQNVLPGYPYLIKPTQNVNGFTANNKCINPSIDPFKVVTEPYTFMGTPGYSTADVPGKPGYSVQYKANDIFVSEGDGKLYVSGDSSYGKGYRAWLKNNKSGTNAVKSISVVMSSFSDDDDTTTSIDVAEMAPDLIEALGIQTGVYNLSGQRVANDTSNLKAGIYIVNGKKTVVR